MTHQLSYGMGGPQAYNGYYRHSGRVTLVGPLLGFLVGIPAAILLGVIYAYADSYIPIVYANIALCAGFGAALGFVPAWVMRLGKVRNVPVALTVIVLVTLLGYYVSWVQWVCVTFDRNLDQGLERPFTAMELAKQPDALKELVSLINETGTFTLGSSHSSSSSGGANVSGAFLTIIWLAEAACIFALAIVVGKRVAGSLPFCESCDRWCDKAHTVMRTPIGAEPEVRRSLETGDLTYVRQLRSSGVPGTSWWQFDLHRCAGCSKLHTLSVVQTVTTADKRGRQQTKTKVVVDRLLITPEQVEELRTLV